MPYFTFFLEQLYYKIKLLRLIQNLQSKTLNLISNAISPFFLISFFLSFRKQFQFFLMMIVRSNLSLNIGFIYRNKPPLSNGGFTFYFNLIFI